MTSNLLIVWKDIWFHVCRFKHENPATINPACHHDNAETAVNQASDDINSWFDTDLQLMMVLG